MRIALLSTNLARGGAESQVASLAPRLRARGHSVSVLSLLPPSAFSAALQDAGVDVFGPPIARLPLLLARLRPHVLHCHLFHANVFGRLLRLLCPFPVVISTIHSVAETGRFSAGTRRRDLMYRVTDRLANVTVAVSSAAAQRHIDGGAVSRSRVRVIPNGVDTERFRPASQPPAAVPFTWLAAGRLMWKKDYPVLLRAFAELGCGRLLIAGGGPDEAALRAMAPPGVEFLGPRDDIPQLMRSAHAFVLSSRIEGFPMVLLEAAASGLPCVATDAGGVREAGVAIVVPPRDPSALAAAMRRVMDLPQTERLRIGAAARVHVCEGFDLGRIVSAWETLYRELLERPWM